MKKSAIVIIAFLFSSGFAFSQNDFKASPLCRFLQQNFDSSIVLTDLNKGNNFLIISNFNKSTYYFSYLNPYEWTSPYSFPGQLKDKLERENLAFYKSAPDTNKYFLPHQVKAQKRNQYWSDINHLDIWNLKGDGTYTDSCKMKCAVRDDAQVRFYLISKAQIRMLDFDAPAFYENCCPGNKYRQAAIAILKIFKTAFPQIR